jgi:phage tail-like protein
VDVNGTRFHLLLGSRDWRPRLAGATSVGDEHPAWDDESQQVTLRRELFRFPPRPSERPFVPADRRGAARDRFGDFYWIGPDRRSVRYRPRTDHASAVFWSVEQLAVEKEQPGRSPGVFVTCAPPPLPALPTLSGLAVTERHFLVVGTLQPSGLLIFDLHGGGPPVWLLWPEAVPFAPFDLAATPDGGLWVLDRATSGSPARLWRLDCDLRVVRATDEIELVPPPLPDAFRPVDPPPAPDCAGPSRTFPTGITLDIASPPVPATGDVLSVVSLTDCTALVMEVDAALDDTRLHRWTFTTWQGGSPPTLGAEPLGAPVSLGQALSDLLEESTSIVGHDMTFIPASSAPPGIVGGKLYVADRAGNQSFEFSLSTGIRGTAEATTLGVEALPAYFPMRQWAGRALVSGADREAYYDIGDGWLSLTELPRPRYATSAFLDGIVFDGKEPGCVWHRLMLDACVPPGDLIAVDSRTADDEDDLAGMPWRTEPALRLRPGGSELPWLRELQSRQAPELGVGTWELLFQQAIGRYVELRLRLRGSGRSSPKIRALRAHYPRFSYATYLPDVYREDAASASFVDRFLANFEGLLTELEGRIASAEVLFDYRTAPREALDFLAEWLGATLDPDWDETRRRLFIANAVELYRRRGTRRGLLAAIRMAVDECPSEENLFADDREGGPFGYRISEAFERGDPAGAHRFTVLVPVGLAAMPADRLRLRETVGAVVKRERPAHAAFDVQLYWALFRVGSARIGQDTALGEGSRFSALVLGAGYLGQSLVGEEHPWSVRDRRVVGRDREGFPPRLG